MIDFSKYTLTEMQAIVTVLDELTDEMISAPGYKDDELADFHIALYAFRKARSMARVLMDQQAQDHAAAEAEKVDRIVQACVAGAPPADDSDEQHDLRVLVDTLSQCSDRLAALAFVEDGHFEKSSEMDAFIKSTVLRNANRSIIGMLADIRDHFREVLQ